MHRQLRSKRCAFVSIMQFLDRLEQLVLAQAKDQRGQLQSLEAKLLQGNQRDLNDMGEAILATGCFIKRLGVTG